MGYMLINDSQCLVIPMTTPAASGRLTLDEWLGLNPWLIAVVLLVVAIIGYRLTTALENKLKE